MILVHQTPKVAAHKTAGTFGRAGIALTGEEYQWFLRFEKIRRRIPGYHAEVTRPQPFFFNSAGGEMAKLGEMVTMVFESMQMYKVTPTVIRTSIATLVSL